MGYLRSNRSFLLLVSRISQLIDEKVSKIIDLSATWTRAGVDDAVNRILSEDNMFFQLQTGKSGNFLKLGLSLRSIVIEGEKISYNQYQNDISQMEIYGFIRNARVMVKGIM